MIRTSAMRRRAAGAVAALGVVTLAACGAGGAGATSASGDLEVPDGIDEVYALPSDFEMTIPINMGQGPDSPGNRPYEEMAKALEEYSGGKITVEWYWSYALHPGNEVVSAVKDNIVPMSFLMPGIEPTGFDTFTWVGEALSAEVPTARPVIGELTTFAGSVEHSLSDEAVLAEYEKIGVTPLIPRVVVHSGYHLLCKEPTTTLADIEGKLTRTAGPNWVSEAEAVGFESVSIPPIEQYEALQRGVVDCVMGPLRDWYSINLLEVAHHLTMDDEAQFVGFPGAFIANTMWWEGLPEGAQNIVWRGMFEWVTEYAQNQPTLDLGGLRIVAESDQHELRPMGDDLRTTLDEFQSHKREDLLAEPPSGLSAEEADQMLASMGDSFDKWLGIAEELGLTEKYPDTWPEMVDFSLDHDWIAEPEWKQRVWDEIFAPQMPNP